GPSPGERAKDMAGRRLLVTAGPTYEDLDPVRYLGNRSTGRMGIALAETAAVRGAEVDLVLGPTDLTTTVNGITVHKVRSAREMHAISVMKWPKADAAILAAAVADYRPAEVSRKKIKKGDKPLRLSLVRNPDIAAELGQDKKDHQRLVGFALETDNGLENARRKMKDKNLDFIVLNSANDEGAAFGHETNKIQLVNDVMVTEFPLKTKLEVADDILDALLLLLTA
ncbi:MAG: phosphopantothenoylcysteine decarboxylase, partial [Bacteroidota bacterium]